jgi:hypothetical protein
MEEEVLVEGNPGMKTPPIGVEDYVRRERCW